MKFLKYCFLNFALLFSINSFSQTPLNYKTVAGWYGSSDGIILYEDSTYLLYGYATMALGTYSFENDRINFKPDKAEHPFEVYGYRNPAIKDTTRFHFLGFDGETTYMQFDQGKITPIFNKRANCFSTPYELDTLVAPKKLTFYADFSYPFENLSNTTAVVLDKDYNDYYLFYNKPSRYTEPFVGAIVKEKGETGLVVSLTGRAFVKRPPEKDNSDNNALNELKQEYDQNKKLPQNILYANSEGNITTQLPEDFLYDSLSNKYIEQSIYDSKENYNNFEPSGYSDLSVLMKFEKLKQHQQSNTKIAELKAGTKSLFFTSCEDAEHSYQPKSKKKEEKVFYKEVNPPPPPPTTKGIETGKAIK